MHFRSKYHSGRDRPDVLQRNNSADVSTLLDHVQASYDAPSPGGATCSDRDSGVVTSAGVDGGMSYGEVTPPKPPVTPGKPANFLVESYIAGLPAEMPGKQFSK